MDIVKNLRFAPQHEIGVLWLKLLKTPSVPFITLQISHYASSIFDQMIAQGDSYLKPKELETLKDFVSEPRNITRYVVYVVRRLISFLDIRK